MTTNTTQDVPTKEDSVRKDEYHGKWKSNADGVSEDDKFGISQNPVQDKPLPAKGLKSVGG